MSLSVYDAKILSSEIKKARAQKHLTQATCAELLDHSISFQKDLERCRCSPSLESFYHICRTLNISADDCIFSDTHRKSNSAYHSLMRLISQCDENQLKIITATTLALLETPQPPDIASEQ